MDLNYLASIKEHTKKCVHQLDCLATQLKEKELTPIEYSAAERLLQVLIEAAIGFCKQWGNQINNFVSTDAYTAFRDLHNAGIINNKELEQWKKIIGLRNTLVHDYLNIDPSVIEKILKEKSYHFIFDFIINNSPHEPKK